MSHCKQISILGCGWLGLPLARRLCAAGYSVKGSVRQENSSKELKSTGIQAFIINIGDQKIEGDFDQFLERSEILIICIPPALKTGKTDNFVYKIKNTLPYIKQSSVNKVLFVSSISVYARAKSIITEDTIAIPESESGIQLLATERLLRKSSDFQTTILRFGGLIGPNRHPIYSILKKGNLKDPQAFVNLIHLDDCINIIIQIILQEKWSEVFNAVTPYHPTKLIYYSAAARNLGQVLPTSDLISSSKEKYISSQKIQSVLNYHFVKSKLDIDL